MRNSKAAIFLSLSPIILCILLTIVGVWTKNVPLISGSGLALFMICFVLFALADKIVTQAKSLREKNLGQLFAQSHSLIWTSILEVISLVSKIPLQFVVLIRAILLSSSFWLIDFYSSLCGGKTQTFSDELQSNALKAFLAIGLGVWDTIRGKTVEKPGLPTRINSAWGAFQFYRSMIILISGLRDSDTLSRMQDFLSNPIWFLDKFAISETFRMTVNIGIFASLFLFLVMPIVCIVFALRAISQPLPDAKHFGIGLAVISCWLLTLGVYDAYVFIQILSKWK